LPAAGTAYTVLAQAPLAVSVLAYGLTFTHPLACRRRFRFLLGLIVPNLPLLLRLLFLRLRFPAPCSSPCCTATLLPLSPGTRTRFGATPIAPAATATPFLATPIFSSLVGLVILVVLIVLLIVLLVIEFGVGLLDVAGEHPRHVLGGLVEEHFR